MPQWLLAPTCRNRKEREAMNEIMQTQPYKVLVRVDDTGRVVAINSDAFITNTGGWTEVLLP